MAEPLLELRQLSIAFGGLRAVQNVVDEGLARPILIGRPDVIESRIERLGLRLKVGENVEVTNINDDPRFNEYWQYYHGLTGRRGVTVAAAKAPRQSRLDTPAFLRRWEYQPPPSTTSMPKIQGRMLRLPPTVWL